MKIKKGKLHTESVLMNVLRGTLVLSLKTPRVTGWKSGSEVPFLNWKVRTGSDALLPSVFSWTSSARAEA